MWPLSQLTRWALPGQAWDQGSLQAHLLPAPLKAQPSGSFAA